MTETKAGPLGGVTVLDRSSREYEVCLTVWFGAL
jgi:hypothetical protein